MLLPPDYKNMVAIFFTSNFPSKSLTIAIVQIYYSIKPPFNQVGQKLLVFTCIRLLNFNDLDWGRKGIYKKRQTFPFQKLTNFCLVCLIFFGRDNSKTFTITFATKALFNYNIQSISYLSREKLHIFKVFFAYSTTIVDYAHQIISSSDFQFRVNPAYLPSKAEQEYGSDPSHPTFGGA